MISQLDDDNLKIYIKQGFFDYNYFKSTDFGRNAFETPKHTRLT